MPTYDFKCNECGAYWEDYTSMSNRVSDCPECGTSDTKQIPNAPAGVLGFLPEFIDVQRPKYHREPPVRVSKVTQRSKVGDNK